MWYSSFSVNIQKTSLRQFFCGGCKTQILMELGYAKEIYLKSLTRTILQKSVFFKVTNKEKLPQIFSNGKRRRIFAHRNFVERSTCKQRGFFDHQNYIKKSKSKQRGFFDHRKCIKKVRVNNVDFSIIEFTSRKVRGKNVDVSTIEITLKKVRGNNVDFSTIKITSKKIRGNNVNFSTIEITSKKVRGNDVDFSISEITSKAYFELTWNSAKFGLRRIDIISTSNRCRFDVVFPLYRF